MYEGNFFDGNTKAPYLEIYDRNIIAYINSLDGQQYRIRFDNQNFVLAFKMTTSESGTSTIEKRFHD